MNALSPSAGPGFHPSAGVGAMNNSSTSASVSSHPPPNPVVFNRTTRFNDLPDDARRQLEMLDSLIQSQCQHADNLKALPLGAEISEGTSFLRQVTSEMHNASSSTASSSSLLESIRRSIDTDASDLIRLTSIVDSYPKQRNVNSSNSAATNPNATNNLSCMMPPGTFLDQAPDPFKFQFDFFSRKTEEMEERIRTYRQTIEFVEVQLKGLFDRPSPAAIVPALKAQYTTFMALADKVAQLDTQLGALKEEYREIWRHQTGSVRDPFAEVDGAFALSV